MPSFGSILGAAIPITANVVAAHNFAQTAEQDKQRQNMIQNIIMQRQQDSADADMMLKRAAAAKDAAQVTMLGNPKLVWRQGANGEWTGFPVQQGTAATPPVAPPTTPAIPPALHPTEDEPQLGMAGANPALPQSVTPPPQGVTPVPNGVVRSGVIGAVKPPPRIDPNAPATLAARTAAKISTDSAAAVNRAANRPAATGRPVIVADPTDPTKNVYVSPADAIGKNAPTKGVGGGIGGGMGSGGIGGLARQSGAITEMDFADKHMTQIEQAIKAGQVSNDGWDYFKKQIANMYDAHGIKDQAAHALAFSNLNQTNPQLANYLKFAEQFSLGDQALSGRGSDFRAKMDAFVSSVGPSANPASIDLTTEGRHTRLEKLKTFQPAMDAMATRISGGGRGAGPAPSAAIPQTGVPGNIDLGAATPNTDPRHVWIAANPIGPHETSDDYRARYEASLKAKP